MVLFSNPDTDYCRHFAHHPPTSVKQYLDAPRIITYGVSTSRALKQGIYLCCAVVWSGKRLKLATFNFADGCMSCGGPQIIYKMSISRKFSKNVIPLSFFVQVVYCYTNKMKKLYKRIEWEFTKDKCKSVVIVMEVFLSLWEGRQFKKMTVSLKEARCFTLTELTEYAILNEVAYFQSDLILGRDYASYIIIPRTEPWPYPT